jgi:2,4-dienoyl-CoA reductase (NADPH2)
LQKGALWKEVAMKPGEKKYPHIFSPGRIGKLITKNRIKYASTETNFNTRDGFVTDQEVAYMEAQARGGAGIVTTQGAYTDPKGEGKGYVGMMGIWDDRYIPGLKRIAEVIHKYDALACLQLMHCGRVGGIELDYCVGPSAVPQRLPIFKPQREMSKEEIQIAIQEHIDGAKRAVEAGFDIIEISGIVGYLISNFISRYTNKRTDEYGGDINSRCRFMVEIIQGIKKAVGDVPVGIRLCGEELLDDRGGNTPEESLESIKIAEKAGIDYLSVTAGWQESAESVITRDIPMGHWLYIAERVKKHIRVPVTMAYRLFLPELPEKAIREEKLDFWEMCRPMIADPELPKKILEDREEEIIPCMACNLCLSRLFRDQPLICLVRPTLGHEGESEWGYYGFEKALKKKRVAVIGGGPAGMQCAVVAAERGHEVVLYEKRSKLGGQLNIASNGPYGDEEFKRLVDYLSNRCKKSGVKIKLNTEATIGNLENPDVVVLASGASCDTSVIPGSNKRNVFSAHDVMEGKVELGRRVCIIGGRGLGIATALYLLVRDRYEVFIIEEGRKIGRDVNPSYIWRYNMKLKSAKALIYTGSKVKEITDRGVLIVNPEGKEMLLEADSIVIALLRSANELEEGLKARYSQVRIIGDALSPRRAHNAIHEGYKTGMEIEKEIYKVDIPLERKFEILSEITRATHFSWREVALLFIKDLAVQELVNKFWEITARETAKGYLKRIDPSKPLPKQIAKEMVSSSIIMGEDAKLVVGKDEDEAFVHHDSCPWYEWHTRLHILEEDQPGCDTWFFKTIEYINQKLGKNVKIETLKSLPKGDACCLRRIWI